MQQTGLLVSAATSLSDVFKEVGPLFARRTGKSAPRFNFGASGTLKQQIEAGAPVDVFASASPQEVDELSSKKRIVAGSRADFATNRLVLIVPVGSRLRGWEDLRTAGHIAVSNPGFVPSGRYAATTLQQRGIWLDITSKIVMCANVRQTLTYVATGDADAGLVFATDAQTEPKRVRVIATATPGRDHEPIIYPAAILVGTTREAEARAFIMFLQGREAQAVLRRRGFGPPPGKGK